MGFPEWFSSKYQKPGESQTHAIHRFAFEHDLGWTTVLRAVKGSRVQSASAKVIASAAGGDVDPASLEDAPTRREIKTAKAAPAPDDDDDATEPTTQDGDVSAPPARGAVG